MSNLVSYERTGVTVRREYAAKLANVINTCPGLKAITDTSGATNSLNVVNSAGFPDPDNAPGAAVGAAGAITGAYAYYVTFYDSDTDTEGNPSPISVTVNPVNQRVTVDLTPITNEGDNTRVTHFRIYRNTTGGAIYYRIATVTVATASYDDNDIDSAINANDTLKLDNNEPQAADGFTFCDSFKKYLFMFGGDNVIWSKVNNPDAYPTVNLTKVARGLYGELRAAKSAGDIYLVYKDRCIIRWTFDEDPSGIFGDGHSALVNTERGAVNHSCVVNVQGTHFALDREGIYMTRTGQDITRLEYPLKELWDRINWDEREKFSAVWTGDRVRFAVALDEDAECHYVFVLDLVAALTGRGQRWACDYYDFGIRHMERQDLGNTGSAQHYNMVRRKMPVAIDNQGYTHVLGIGYRDGVHAQITAEGTVSAATLGTLTDASATFTLTNKNGDAVSPVGCYVRFLEEPDADRPFTSDWSQPYRIASATATQLTITPLMPSIPPVGTKFVIGAIPRATLKTPQMSFGNSYAKKKTGQMRLEHANRGVEFTIRYRISTDRKGFWEMQKTDPATQSRFQTTDDLDYITLRMGGRYDAASRVGLLKAPTSDQWFYYEQMQFDATGVDKPARIDSLDVELLEVVDAAT